MSSPIIRTLLSKTQHATLTLGSLQQSAQVTSHFISKS